jgi:hypothetical protein
MQTPAVALPHSIVSKWKQSNGYGFSKIPFQADGDKYFCLLASRGVTNALPEAQHSGSRPFQIVYVPARSDRQKLLRIQYPYRRSPV